MEYRGAMLAHLILLATAVCSQKSAADEDWRARASPPPSPQRASAASAAPPRQRAARSAPDWGRGVPAPKPSLVPPRMTCPSCPACPACPPMPVIPPCPPCNAPCTPVVNISCPDVRCPACPSLSPTGPPRPTPASATRSPEPCPCPTPRTVPHPGTQVQPLPPQRIFPLGYDFRSLPVGVYKFYRERLVWQEAKSVCARDGAHLASPDSQVELEMLLWLMILDNISSILVGFNDIQQEGHFVDAAGKPMSLASRKMWQNRQPNGGRRQNCVDLRDGQLYDEACSQKNAFVCEITNV